MTASKEREDAVSPVVGVMLMLVVVIIIAAIVSGFASGLAETVDKAPTTSFEITMRAGPDVGINAASSKYAANPSCVILKILSGDSIPSSDIQIITSYEVPAEFNGVATTYAGRVVKHTLDGSLGRVAGNQWSEPVNPEDVFTPTTNGYYTTLAPGNGMVGNNQQFFGECVFQPGFDYWFTSKSQFLGFDTSDYSAYGFQEGAVVHVTVLHIPTGQTMFDQDVTVGW